MSGNSREGSEAGVKKKVNHQSSSGLGEAVQDLLRVVYSGAEIIQS